MNALSIWLNTTEELARRFEFCSVLHGFLASPLAPAINKELASTLVSKDVVATVKDMFDTHTESSFIVETDLEWQIRVTNVQRSGLQPRRTNTEVDLREGDSTTTRRIWYYGIGALETVRGYDGISARSIHPGAGRGDIEIEVPAPAMRSLGTLQAFETFIRSTIGDILPKTVVYWPDDGEGSDDPRLASLIYHESAVEFVRDLLRALLMMDDWLRIFGGAEPDIIRPKSRFYLAPETLEPEVFFSGINLTEFESRFRSRYANLPQKHLGPSGAGTRVDLELLSLCCATPMISKAIGTLGQREIERIVFELDIGFERLGRGLVISRISDVGSDLRDVYRKLTRAFVSFMNSP